MVWWIVLGALVIASIICLVLGFGFDIDWAGIMGCVGIVAIVVVVIFRAYSIHEKKPDEKYEICSLTSNTHTDKKSNGLFILGVGKYNNESKKKTNYFFYKKEEQGGWKLTRVNAYKTVIFEDENKKPYFVKVNKIHKAYDELHLPKNTIKKDINKIDIAELIK